MGGLGGSVGAVLLSRALPGSLGGGRESKPGRAWTRLSGDGAPGGALGGAPAEPGTGPGRAACAQRRAGREPAWGGERRGQEKRERERRGEEKEPVDAYITCLYQADPMFLTNSHSYINKSNKPNKINSKEINTYITE